MNQSQRVNVMGSKKRTVIGARVVGILLIGVPRHNIDKIGDKRWNQTFQYGRIPPNDMLFVHIGLVVLGNNWIFVLIRILFWHIRVKKPSD